MWSLENLKVDTWLAFVACIVFLLDSSALAKHLENEALSFSLLHHQCSEQRPLGPGTGQRGRGRTTVGTVYRWVGRYPRPIEKTQERKRREMGQAPDQAHR